MATEENKEEKYQKIKQEFIDAGASDELMDYLEKLKPYLFIEQEKQDGNTSILQHLQPQIAEKIKDCKRLRDRFDYADARDYVEFGVKIALEEQQWISVEGEGLPKDSCMVNIHDEETGGYDFATWLPAFALFTHSKDSSVRNVTHYQIVTPKA